MHILRTHCDVCGTTHPIFTQPIFCTFLYLWPWLSSYLATLQYCLVNDVIFSHGEPYGAGHASRASNIYDWILQNNQISVLFSCVTVRLNWLSGVLMWSDVSSREGVQREAAGAARQKADDRAVRGHTAAGVRPDPRPAACKRRPATTDRRRNAPGRVPRHVRHPTTVTQSQIGLGQGRI